TADKYHQGPRVMVYCTIHQKQCAGECQYHECGNYFWCKTDDSNWDCCSPTRQHLQGYYSWRYTSYNNDCDCCGTIRPGEYSQSYRRKRQRDNPNVICTREENNNRRATAFREEGESNMMAETSNRLRNEARSNLITLDNLRIDNQGQCNRNNQRCCIVQVQINKARRCRESTTVAQIICPLDTSSDFMRSAFRRSLQRDYNGSKQQTEHLIKQQQKITVFFIMAI
uniref:Uncharacterized protein n=1 Tax=Scophthalmus maximus TaxID=52904 RepID=A0A8D3DHN7_SCOMX